MFSTGALVFLFAATAATEGMRSIREVGSLPNIKSGMLLRTSRFVHSLIKQA